MSQLCLLLLCISEVHDTFMYLNDVCQNVFSCYFLVLHKVIVKFQLRLFCMPAGSFPQTFSSSWRNRHGIVLISYVFEEHHNQHTHTPKKKIRKGTRSILLLVFSALFN